MIRRVDRSGRRSFHQLAAIGVEIGAAERWDALALAVEPMFLACRLTRFLYPQDDVVRAIGQAGSIDLLVPGVVDCRAQDPPVTQHIDPRAPVEIDDDRIAVDRVLVLARGELGRDPAADELMPPVDGV